MCVRNHCVVVNFNMHTVSFVNGRRLLCASTSEVEDEPMYFPSPV